MTRDELVELLTVERFAPWRPAPSAQVENHKRPRRRVRPAPPAMPSGPLLVPLDDPDVIARRVSVLQSIDEDSHHERTG